MAYPTNTSQESRNCPYYVVCLTRKNNSGGQTKGSHSPVSCLWYVSVMGGWTLLQAVGSQCTSVPDAFLTYKAFHRLEIILLFWSITAACLCTLSFKDVITRNICIFKMQINHEFIFFYNGILYISLDTFPEKFWNDLPFFWLLQGWCFWKTVCNDYISFLC